MANLTRQYQIFLGEKIRSERTRKGISQEQLGELAKVHRTYVGMIERGEKNITLQNLVKFAKALGLQVRDLIDF
jgi:XRE family transcriptional regulator, regulator of sulfur utilization